MTKRMDNMDARNWALDNGFTFEWSPQDDPWETFIIPEGSGYTIFDFRSVDMLNMLDASGNSLPENPDSSRIDESYHSLICDQGFNSNIPN